MKSMILYLALVISLLGESTYFLDTLKGKTKPNKVTWLIWTLGPLIAFIAQIKQGVGLEALFTLSAVIVSFSILLASFFNPKAYWKISKSDIIFGVLAILGLILWQITSVANLAILFSILADASGSVPTVIKSYKYPDTESLYAYVATSLAGLLTVFASQDYHFKTIAFAFYLFFINGLIALIIISTSKEKVK